MTIALAKPETLEQLRDAVAAADRVRLVGGGSKSNLSRDANVSLAGLRGVLEYDPREYTITALAGTPLAELQQVLAENGQYFPFDPPLAARGATLGGATAAGTSGPGALRHGPLRDFLLGVRFVTGDGQIIFGGGKVVKNAAGFDFPKLMAGALGELGVLAELTLKVFPRPERLATLEARYDDRDDAVAAMQRLAVSQMEPSCLDIDPQHRLRVRLAGADAGVIARIERARSLLEIEVTEIDDATAWDAAREFTWLGEGDRLVKTAGPLPRLLQLLDALALPSYRLSLAGHVAWLALPAGVPSERLAGKLEELELPAIALLGDGLPARLGRDVANQLFQRLQRALDPPGKLARDAFASETLHAASN